MTEDRAATRTSVRWGVLSTAKIGRNHVLTAIKNAELCELTAIASRDAGRAASVAGEFDIPNVHGSYEALLADPEVDAVYIPLPNDLHAPWVRAAADAGKHVLCEKPLALDAAEAESLEVHCRERGVMLMEAFMYRFHPAWPMVRRLLEDGAIGRLTTIEVWFAFRSAHASDDYRLRHAAGGGALLDLGCYAVNLSRWLLGDEPVDVAARAWVDPRGDVDLTFSAILDYVDARSVFTVSIEQEPDHRVRLHGSEGWISIADPFNCPRDHTTTITVATGGDSHPHQSTRRSIDVEAADQYGLQASAFSKAILAGAPAPVAAADAVANMRLLGRLFDAAGVPGPSSGA